MTDSNDNNPYAPPRSPVVTPVRPILNEPRIERDCIVVNSGFVLPLRCVKTNAACDLTNQKLRKLSYAPSFRLVTRRRTCRVYRCLSEPQRKRQLVIWLVVYLITFALLWIFGGGPILAGGFATIVITAFPSDRLKVVNYKSGEFWIKGLPNDYLESLVVEDGWKRV